MAASRNMDGWKDIDLGCGNYAGRRAATCRPREKEWIEMTTSTRELILDDIKKACERLEEVEGNE